MWRISVVLPVPLGPMIAVIRPRGMSRSTPSKMVLPFSTVRNPRMRISGSVLAVDSGRLAVAGGVGIALGIEKREVLRLAGAAERGATLPERRCGRKRVRHVWL